MTDRAVWPARLKLFPGTPKRIIIILEEAIIISRRVTKGGENPEDGKLVCEAFAEEKLEKLVGGKVGGKAMRNSTEEDQGKISSAQFEKVLGGPVVIRNENRHFLIYFVL